MKNLLLCRYWLPLLLLVVISGCTVGPDFKPPEPPVPDDYRTPAVNRLSASESLEWWTLFDDPQLYTLVKAALDNNRNLKVAISRIEQARANLGYTDADRYPRIDIDGGAQIGTLNHGSLSEDTNSNIYISAPVSWEIDFWGKFRRASEAARADLLASEYGYKAVQLALISDVVSNYYQLLDFHQRLNIAMSTLVSREVSLKIIVQRFEKGIISELDVNQAQIQREIAAGAIPFYRRAIAKAENNLGILLGQLPGSFDLDASLARPVNLPEIPVGIPSEILERRPDIAQSLYRLNAQTARIGIAQAQRLPSISLTGALGLASTELASVTTDGGGWSVGGGLLGPLLDFNKSKSRVVIEEQKTRQALFQYENVVLNAFREVEDALVEIRTYRHEFEALVRQQQAAKSANNLSKQRYDKGFSSYLEVLDTERTLFSVELKVSDLQRQYRDAYVKLYKALGGGWGSKEERDAAEHSELFRVQREIKEKKGAMQSAADALDYEQAAKLRDQIKALEKQEEALR